jgi:hypothetical protein
MPNMRLVGVVSVDDFSVVVRFYVSRPAEQWLGENIEGYDDPIMAFESADSVLDEIALIL